ncbi:MAG TPA: hypothetical protein VMR17_15660 [Xanthobacteraceae bacterium]|jgi:ABC-type sugar transport system substrate-binding protein|nr:hypothetical protein [Xanthobacteraceae bacterium]
MSTRSTLALAAALASLSLATPAFAQSYAFPTYAYLHPQANSDANVAGKVAVGQRQLYNSTVVPEVPTPAQSTEWPTEWPTTSWR